MAKVKVPFTVRYGGIKYAPHTPIDVEEKDVLEMLGMGAVLIEEETPAKEAKEEAPAEVKKTRAPRKTAKKE